MNVRGNIIEIKRGEIGWSELTMAKRWRWSREKVRRFLSYLQETGKVRQQKTHITTIITIINYDRYQQVQTTDDTSDKTTGETTEKQQTRQDRNKVKKVKNIDGALSSKVPPDKNETYVYFRDLGLSKEDAKNQTIQFHDHHDARGWVLSNRKKMVDWKAAVRTWKRNVPVYSQQNGKINGNGKVHFKTREELTAMMDVDFWKYYAPYRQYCESPNSTFFPTRDEAITWLLQHFANMEAKYARC